MDKNGRLKEALQITWVGIIANIFLVIIKFIAGILGRSTAIVADAVHSLSDFASDITVIAGLKLGCRPADRTHPYGHGKFETLSAVVLGFILIVTGSGIFYAGASRIAKVFNGEILDRPGWIALLAAVLSIVIKEALYRYTKMTGERIESQAVIANAIHHRSDALSSVAALVGVGGAVLLGEKWRLLDPLASLLVSFFIIRVSLSIVKKSLDELLEASLGKDTEVEILQSVKAVSGVINPHNLRSRRIGSNVAVDLHIEVDKTLNISDAHDISLAVEEIIKQRFGRDALVTVHVDPEGLEYD